MKNIKKILFTLFTALMLGIVTLFWSTIIKVGALDAHVAVLENKHNNQACDIKEMKTMVEKIYWYLIERKGIEIPEKSLNK